MVQVKGFRPLPDGVELRRSNIHGYGIFATKEMKSGCDLGITHIADARFPDGYIRTALGSYANHSKKPNIKMIKDDDTYHFVLCRDVRKGEELLCDYANFNYDENILKNFT